MTSDQTSHMRVAVREDGRAEGSRPAAVLRAERLVVNYGTARALDGVSLSVWPGESVAVVGSSGSGKSTLLHCLSGLRVPDAGEVWLENRDLTSMSDRERSALRLSTMGVVFQFGELLPELTVLENVSLPQWMAGRSRSEADRAATELLEAFEIGHLALRHPGDVSGGERQRAAVARALAHNPRVVLADEPTGSLDSDNADRVMSALVERARMGRTALVLVTHEHRFAQQCDRTLMMRDGHLCPAGGPPS